MKSLIKRPVLFNNFFSKPELDSDLQPWDKSGARKPILSELYNNSQIWVYGDFLLEDIDTLPAGWISTQKLLPNVRDHRASRCDDAKQKRSLWPAPVHRLVGLYVLSQSFKEFDQTFISRCTWIPACHHYNFPIVWKYNIGI